MNLLLLIKPLLGFACVWWIFAAVFGAHPRFSKTALCLAWLLNLAVFAFNCFFAQAPAFGNMFHVMVFLPLVLPVFLWYARRFLGYTNLLPYVAAIAVLTLVGTLSMNMQADWRQMPALQSLWFVPHVFAYLVSYALLGVATALAVRSLWGLPETKTAFIKEAADIVRVAFAFLTFGLCSGALWAAEVWGGYWSWDMKEVWALITWGLYLLFFHLDKKQRFSGLGKTLLLVAFLALLVTFFVVNYLPLIQSLHAYAQ